MIEALREKYLRKSRKNGIICFIIGLVLALIMFKDWLPIGNTINLDNVKTVDEIKEGRASLTVFYIYDYFMYYTDSYTQDETNAAMRDYFVLVGSNFDADQVEQDLYISVQLSGSKNKRAYKLMEDMWTNENFDWDNADYISTKGHIRKMDSDEQEYWEEYLTEVALDSGMTFEDISVYFVPYMFEPNKITGIDSSEYLSIIGVVAAVVCLVMGIVNLIQGFFGNPLKDLERYGKKHNGEEAARMKAEILYEKKIPNYGMLADEDMFIFDNGSKLCVEDPKDILWAYEHVVTRKTNFVTVGKDYFVKIRTASGGTIDIPCKQQEVHPILRALHDICPDVVFGYSKDIEREYTKNRQNMINEVLRRREERYASNAFGMDTASTSYADTATTSFADSTATVDADSDAAFSVDHSIETESKEDTTVASLSSEADNTDSSNDKMTGFFS